ncbi:MAG: helix-turn-helix domain-containing protein [Candidatus Woesearchaeota archaeon]
MDVSELRKVGLGKNEVDVYLSLLKYGEGSVSKIAKTCSVHRVNIYEAARSLVSKGLVSEFLNKDVSVFKANEPTSIISYLQLQQENVRAIIPQLQQSYDSHKDVAQTFYGADGIKHILNDMIETKQSIYAFGIPKEVPQVIGEFTKTFHRNRIREKISIFHIYNVDAKERINFLNKIKYSKARHLDKNLDSPATTIVYGDKVAFWIFGDEVFSVLIKSQTMAKSYKNYFDFLWKIAK